MMVMMKEKTHREDLEEFSEDHRIGKKYMMTEVKKETEGKLVIYSVLNNRQL